MLPLIQETKSNKPQVLRDTNYLSHDFFIVYRKPNSYFSGITYSGCGSKDNSVMKWIYGGRLRNTPNSISRTLSGAL